MQNIGKKVNNQIRNYLKNDLHLPLFPVLLI